MLCSKLIVTNTQPYILLVEQAFHFSLQYLLSVFYVLYTLSGTDTVERTLDKILLLNSS